MGDKDLFCNDDKEAIVAVLKEEIENAKAIITGSGSDGIEAAKASLAAAESDLEKITKLRGEWDSKKDGPLNQNRSEEAVNYENSGAGIENYRRAYQMIKHEQDGESNAWE